MEGVAALNTELVSTLSVEKSSLKYGRVSLLHLITLTKEAKNKEEALSLIDNKKVRWRGFLVGNPSPEVVPPGILTVGGSEYSVILE